MSRFGKRTVLSGRLFERESVSPSSQWVVYALTVRLVRALEVFVTCEIELVLNEESN